MLKKHLNIMLSLSLSASMLMGLAQAETLNGKGRQVVKQLKDADMISYLSKKRPPSGGGGGTPGAVGSGNVPAGLPKVFAFGLQSKPGETTQTADMKPLYRYQYLTGGLGQDNWRNWNSPDGAFVSLYLNESRSAGVIPVLTYYQLVPISNYDEMNLPVLGDAAKMAGYFADWKALMQKCAEVGGTIVVHIEPDVSAQLQRRNNDPALIPVKVASSGFPDVAGLPDNAKGLYQALVKIRNAYAPNVLLGYHISHWATGPDVILNRDSNPETVADQTIAFYKALGAPHNLLFSEFSDRTAGYYEKVVGTNRWWSDADFDRFQLFLKRAATSTGLKFMLWQIPVGNKQYKTLNNSTYHYQDNRPDYFLKGVLDSNDTTRIRHYGNADVIALLFGHGIVGDTHFLDYAKDGITNPAAINGNTLTATVTDDDGGFLRAGFKKYYGLGAVPLNP